MKEDARAIFKAANMASKASDYRRADWRAMQAALLGRGGGLDPDGAIEIELISARAENFAARR